MSAPQRTERMRTGIAGLDEALGGGLPRGRVALVVGDPGAGKTLFALQSLAEGARLGEAGVFLTFEESPRDLLANMAAFPWAPSASCRARLSMLDGRELRAASRNGGFDLAGLLSAMEHRCRRIGARRLAIDGLDVLLDMIEDPAVMQREVYRLADWLSRHALTAIITTRRLLNDETLPARYALLPFVTDCVMVLQNRIEGHNAARRLRILKCRGTAHSANELAMVLSSAGLEVDAPRTLETPHRISSQRISTGVARLDTMLDGGYLRGTCTLVSGAPGTAKTSMAGAFVVAACRRGERALFVTLEESSEAITRNLASVDIRLGRFVRSGLLRISSVPESGTAAEAHTLRIAALLQQEQARCLVIDPVSALMHPGASDLAFDSLLGLLDQAKRRGVTVLVTASVVDGSSPTEENSAVGLSSIADTWMHVTYLAAAGERNRALTIVKSRGTAHSNQVRELVLTKRGISLVDVYTAGGAVLMGALRRQKEEQEHAEHIRMARADQARRAEVAASIAEVQARMASLRADLEHKELEMHLLKVRSESGAARGAANLAVLRSMRGADLPAKRARRAAAEAPRRRRTE